MMMLKWSLISVLAFVVFMFFFSKTDAYFYLTEKIIWGHDYLTVWDAEKRWGNRTFDGALFRSGKNRKEMAVDLIRSEVLIGLTNSEVRNLLGEADGGYFMTEGILTYSLFIDRDAQQRITEAYSLLVLRRNLSNPESQVNGVYIWKDR